MQNSVDFFCDDSEEINFGLVDDWLLPTLTSAPRGIDVNPIDGKEFPCVVSNTARNIVIIPAGNFGNRTGFDSHHGFPISLQQPINHALCGHNRSTARQSAFKKEKIS